MERQDDFARRREHLKDLSEEELYQRFWQLTDDIMSPLVDMARKYTSPSIERSVLLRMGFDSLQAKELVKKIGDRELLGKGAGHVVLKVAQEKGITVKEAGQALIDDRYWDLVDKHWGGGK